ncbi:hypothetical protein [Sphingorhabdus sp.]|jgi:type I restriction enzyme S subunit|uniref:hypothetical protein n=1 Tax=Sphingorhabdus sp. TaxID=1902408 RepID=UPI0037CC4995
MNEVLAVPALRFSEFDGAWGQHRLNQVTSKIQDGTHFSPELADNGAFKYITSKNIRQGYLDLGNVDHISEIAHRDIYRRCDVKFGDVLLTKDGASTGACCLNTLDEEFSLLSSVAFVRAKSGTAIGGFIFFALSSSIGQKQIFESVAGQAITRITC